MFSKYENPQAEFATPRIPVVLEALFVQTVKGLAEKGLQLINYTQLFCSSAVMIVSFLSIICVFFIRELRPP